MIEIDHPMIKVASLEGAAEQMKSLGFSVSPVGNFEAFGCRNQCVLLTPRRPGAANFIEMMTVDQPGQLPSGLGFLHGGAGIKTLVHITDDAERTRDRLITLGYAVPPIQTVHRNWTMPDGRQLAFEFRLVIPEGGQSPLMFSFYETTTLGNYLLPELRRHPNGALRMTSLTVVADANVYTPLIGHFSTLYAEAGRSEHRKDGATRYQPKDVALDIVTPHELQARYGDLYAPCGEGAAVAAITIEVADLDIMRGFLDEDALVERPGDQEGFYVKFGAADGLILEFTPAQC